MKKWLNRLRRNRWQLIGSTFPYPEEYRLYNPRLDRYLNPGTSYSRAVRWKRKLNQWWWL